MPAPPITASSTGRPLSRLAHSPISEVPRRGRVTLPKSAPGLDDQQELASVPGPLLLRHQSERARTPTRGARSARNPIAGRQVQLVVVAAQLPVDSCDVQRATSHETRQLKRADEISQLPSFSLG